MLGIDFETSGHSRWSRNQAVEIGLVEIKPDGTWSILASSLLSGARWISPRASEIHGIRLWHCRGMPPLKAFASILKEVKELPFCVHGKGTERKVLREELGFAPERWVDSLTLSRRHLKNCPDYRLETVTAHLGLKPELDRMLPRGRWHQAAYDAAASALIVREIEKNEGATARGLPEIIPTRTI